MITKNPKNIYVIDDDLFFRQRLSDILEAAGHRVFREKSPEGFIHEIKKISDSIDLLLLDLHMPGMDGFAVLEWLDKNGYKDKFRVLVITGVYEATEIIEVLKKHGVFGLMSKTLTPEQIIFRINKVLFLEKAGLKRVERVPTSIPVNFALGDIPGIGTLLNISETGTFLNTEHEILEGAVLKLEFHLPYSGKLVTAKGLVRWSAKNSAEKGFFNGYGIMFNYISNDYLNALKEFILLELTNQKKIFNTTELF